MLHSLHNGSAVVLEGSETMAPLQHREGGFAAVGIEHSTAGVAVRELVAILGEVLEDTLRTLAAHPVIAEVVVLSTCNRTELYLSADDVPAAAEVAWRFLEDIDARVRPHLRRWVGKEAVEHLFRVTSGLESQVLGERQIMSQVREALARAERLATVGPDLHQLFRSAIACARDVHERTGLGRIDHSIAAESVRCAEAALGSLEERTALVIGGGEVSRSAVSELRDRNIGVLYVANRTSTVAQEIAAAYGGIPVPLSEMEGLLPDVDAVISATSSPGRILTADLIARVDVSQRAIPIHIYDLALPRDVDPAIRSLRGVVLHDLDSIVSVNYREHQQSEVQLARTIIEHHAAQLQDWHRTRRLAPVIGTLRQQLSALAAAELDRMRPKLGSLAEDELRSVDVLLNRVTSSIFHQLVTRARLAIAVDERQVDEAIALLLGGPPGAEEPGASPVLGIGA